jgi:polar amino acid transport system substrate-binding protein
MEYSLPEVLQELAPTGRLRTAINCGNPVLAQLDSRTGEATGVSVDLAREFGRRLGIPVELIIFNSAGKVFDALNTSSWDIAFLAADPLRATQIDFTTPYVVIEGTYLVQNNSPLWKIEDFDKEGIRIAVGMGSAYDLYLTRTLKNAELMRAPTSADAIDLFIAEQLDAAAGIKQPLVDYARTHPDLRVIQGKFTSIEQAIGTPKGRSVGSAYLQAFIEEMKSSGFVAAGLKRSGQTGAEVAPLNNIKSISRIPYQPANIGQPEELVASIRARRGGLLLNLDRMLLHSPPFAKGWNTLLQEVRGGLNLSPKLRELAICGVAALNGAEYEFHHHSPEFEKAGGTAAQVDALHDFKRAACDEGIFDASEREVMRLTLEMTCEVQVSDRTFAAVRDMLPDNQCLVELVGVIATYNMVSRFLVALAVQPEQVP